MLPTSVYNTFRPSDEVFSAREAFQVQAYRLLFSIGAVFVLLYGPLYYAANPNAIDPIWLRVVVAGVGGGAVAASYLSDWARCRFAVLGLGVSVIVVAWGILLCVLNGFSGDYKVGLLLLHAVFTVFAGFGARSIRPVIWFALISLVGTIGAVLASEVSLLREGVLLSSMAGLSLVVGGAVHRMIMIREELEERETRLRGLANSVPGVVFQFYARPNGTWGHHFVSQHAEEVLGISAEPEGFVDRVAERVPSPHRQRVLQSIQDAVSESKPWRVEFPFEKPAGGYIWLLGTSTPEKRKKETVYNGFLIDITERKRAEYALRQSKQEAEKASQVKTAMLANMSHEVRTPLTSIIGFSELLRDNLDGELNAFARRTHESSRRLLETLESVLKLSKLEAGAATLERESVVLQEAMRKTVDLLQPRAEEQSIAIDTTWPEQPVVGQWNVNAVRRIGRNLLENALKFTPEGGRVTVRIDQTDEQALLEVEDTGVGIREDQLPEIFQAFRQESEGIRREYEGSGLGLSIVDHLVEEFGGMVEVDTEKGEGTCFTVYLPFTSEDAEASAPASSSSMPTRK